MYIIVRSQYRCIIQRLYCNGCPFIARRRDTVKPTHAFDAYAASTIICINIIMLLIHVHVISNKISFRFITLSCTRLMYDNALRWQRWHPTLHRSYILYIYLLFVGRGGVSPTFWCLRKRLINMAVYTYHELSDCHILLFFPQNSLFA